jgi:hypothetical protein
MAASAMVDPGYVRTMAAYNAEMNRRLYEAAWRIPERERRQDRGAFWGSLHGTLCHLLWGDRMWMARFDGWEKPVVIQKESAALIEDFDELRHQRVSDDAQISAWAARVTPGVACRGHGLVQRIHPARAAPAARFPGDAFLQSSNTSSRPGACADHRVRREDR